MNYFDLKFDQKPYDQSEIDAYSFKPVQNVQAVEHPKSIDYGQVAQGAATGAAMGGPAGAAIGAGGSFLTQYIAQKAADERAKRAAINQAYQNQANSEQQIYNTLMASAARSLR